MRRRVAQAVAHSCKWVCNSSLRRMRCSVITNATYCVSAAVSICVTQEGPVGGSLTLSLFPSVMGSKSWPKEDMY